MSTLLHLSQGPKIRTGSFNSGAINIQKGQKIILTVDEAFRLTGDENKFYVDYKDLLTTAKEVCRMRVI